MSFFSLWTLRWNLLRIAICVMDLVAVCCGSRVGCVDVGIFFLTLLVHGVDLGSESECLLRGPLGLSVVLSIPVHSGFTVRFPPFPHAQRMPPAMFCRIHSISPS
jgi:hypothetical protein